MDFSVLDISSALGLMAACVLTGNILLGIMLSTNYQRHEYWQKVPDFLKKFDIYDVHNWTAYIALALILAHPALLLLDKSTRFEPVHLLIPGGAPHQAFYVSLGVISFYAFVIVIITTQKTVKKRLGFKTWKIIHFLSLVVTPLFLIHGIVMDPLLKDRPVDFIDAEKVVSELCLLTIIVAFILRMRYKTTL